MLPTASAMKNDSNKNDERIASTKNISNPTPRKKIISRAGWSEDSKAIARAGDDYLRLGDFPNLEDKNIEW